MFQTVIYSGRIEEDQYEENYRALFIGDVRLPLAKKVQQDMWVWGDYLSVRYWVSDEPQEQEQLEEGLIYQAMGYGTADYYAVYSEITGYLWTNEDIRVGGHDLIEELRNYVGSFCLLEIKYSKSGEGE